MLVSLLLGTLSILLAQLVLAVALAGIGLAVRRGAGLKAIRLDDCFLAFWVGLACVTLFLLCWNFLLPVTGTALLVVLAAGTLGGLACRRELARAFEQDAWRPSAAVVALLLLTALWIANLSLGQLDNYDSGLYHLQAVRWAEHFPAVPGIGNLDAPLAFNNANLLFDALLSAGPWEGRSNHLANGLFVLVFLAQCLVAGARLAGGDRSPHRLFAFLLLAPAASLALNGNVSSFVTDLAPSLVLLVAASQLYALLSSGNGEARENSYALVALAMLLATAVTFKSNTAPFAATGVPVAVALALRSGRLSGARPLRLVTWAAAAVVLFASAWMGRGIVLSGYPLFPTSVAGFPVEWRVPAEHADAEFAYIVHSGRASTQNLPVVAGEAGFASWFPGWRRHALDNPYDVAVPTGLVLLGAAAFLAVRRRTPVSGRIATARAWWLLVPFGVAIVAWFSVAPEPRYALPYFWGLAALLWSQVFRFRLALASPLRIRPLLAAGAVLAISPLLLNPIVSRESPFRQENPLKAILKSNFNRPGSDLWFQPVAEQPVLTTYRTRSGLVLNTVPAQCWDAPLPCTPNPAPNLRLRNPPRLGDGFVVDGAWQMENWPMQWQPDFLAAWRSSRVRSGR